MILKVKSDRVCDCQPFWALLISLKVSAHDRHVSSADHETLDEILLALSGNLWSQLSAAAIQVSDARREGALLSVGIQPRNVPSLAKGIPQAEKHLFGNRFASFLQREIDSKKQAAELSRELRPKSPAPPR